MAAYITALPVAPTPQDPHLYDPSRKPDSRFQRVLELINHRPRPLRCKFWDDQIVRDMRTFMLGQRRSNERQRKRLVAQFPSLAAALEVYQQSDQERRVHVECRILAGQSDRLIADRVGLTVETVATYAALFFDVRDRLHFRLWIESAVLDSSRRQSMPEFERWMKVLAFAAGPAGIESLLNNGPARREQIRNVAALAEKFSKAIASEYTATQKAELTRFVRAEKEAEYAASATRKAFAAAARQAFVTVEDIDRAAARSAR